MLFGFLNFMEKTMERLLVLQQKPKLKAHEVSRNESPNLLGKEG